MKQCFLLCVLTVAVSACISGPATKHQAFRRIQEHEAVIAETTNLNGRSGDGTALQKRKACQAADAICEIAEDIDDPDAFGRCKRAQRITRSYQENHGSD